MSDKGICEVCGREAHTRDHWVILWDYGVRTEKIRKMCRTCIDLQEKGEL